MNETFAGMNIVAAPIDYLDVEEKIRARYRLVVPKYRDDDEIEVTTENHRRLAGRLAQVCRSFSRPLIVLDVGCGTGRYFHCLENVERLVGIDISEEMLEAAKSPVLREEISVGQIELLRQNAFLADFPSGSFDFIYSLGMFGHGCPVTAAICNRFHAWLKPQGKVLFNIVDFAGLPLCARTRRRVRNLLYPRLGTAFRGKLDEREKRSPFFALSRKQLLGILSASRFTDFEISSHPCRSPLWTGRHLECLATNQS